MEHVTFLTRPEQRAAIQLIRSHPGLLKYDPSRGLPLKKGGTTDTYINIRDHRSAPESTGPLARIYANALRRLDVDRFVEVPSSVSGIAGVVSYMTGIPYATIRETEKSGRVGNAKLIGEIFAGERVAILDDVITDGASKLDAYHAIRAAGATPILVVLVDREQGWQQMFQEHGVDMDVWAGATLHDVRKEIFVPIGHEDPKVIVALDGMNRQTALQLASSLQGTGCGLKVNDLLLKEGFAIAEDLAVYGPVMLDPKLHDIPNTIGNYCQHIIDMDPKFYPWALTIHASGGRAMMQKAVDMLHPHGIKTLAVTVLTSLSDDDCGEIFGRKSMTQVLRLVELVDAVNVGSIVCSPKEIGKVKGKYPDLFGVTPGVRSPEAETNDQKRVMAPTEAMEAGANAIVSGRQIINADDPAQEVRRIVVEELGLKC